MGRARYLAENFFNEEQFSAHTLSANEETTGNEVWRVGTARRVGGTLRNYWTPTTANQDAWIKVQCNRARAADMLVIDRGHNLEGATVRLQASSDDFTTYSELVAVTLPSSVVPNSRLSDNPGAKTEEGAWLISFDLEVGLYWRVYIDAMGSGLKPQIPGLYLGLSFSPAVKPQRPFDDESRRLEFRELRSPSLWVGASRKAQRREVVHHLLLTSDAEYDQARYHFHSLYWRGDVMWNAANVDQAEKAWLAYAPSDLHSAVASPDFRWRRIDLALLEHEPKAAR